jgi:hypothetical protein
MEALRHALLEQNILHGINLLTILGFVAMGIALTQSRRGRRRVAFAFGLMALGTVCVMAGLYFSHVAP